MVVAGIDLGGTTIKVGIVADGKLLQVSKVPADASGSLQAKLPEVALVIEDMVRRSTDNGRPDAVGLAFPSIVDSDNNRILSEYVKFTDACTLDLPAWFRQRWDAPLAMENDARAALVGEWKFGAGRGHSDIVMCTIGTGFGSAVLSGGQLFKGAHYVGGNLGGHMTIDFLGDTCNCGGIGCVETHGSSWVLQSRYGSRPELQDSSLAGHGELNFRDVFYYAARGDAFATEIRDHAIDAWGAAVINLIHAFDPTVVLFAGGVMQQHEIILPRIQEKVDRHTWPPAGTYAIEPAANPEHAGVLGIAHLAEETARSSHPI